MSKEIDNYLKDVFKKIREILQEEYEYIKDFDTPEYQEIKEDYLEFFEDVDRIAPRLKGIGSLVKMDDDDIQVMYEALAMYEGCFVLSPEGSENRLSEDEEYGKLSYILEMFSLDDEDEE